MAWPQLGNLVAQKKRPILKWVGRTIYKLMGWKLAGNLPNTPKMVVVAVPHSSNVDFILALSVIWGWGIKVNFLGKHTLFKFPHGFFFKGVGGIPVDRRSPQGLVTKMTEEFNKRKELILGIAPEGTRSSDGSLKEGFARIAQAASVPVIPAIVNHKTRTISIGTVIEDLSGVTDIIDAVREQALLGARRAPVKV